MHSLAIITTSKIISGGIKKWKTNYKIIKNYNYSSTILNLNFHLVLFTIRLLSQSPTSSAPCNNEPHGVFFCLHYQCQIFNSTVFYLILATISTMGLNKDSGSPFRVSDRGTAYVLDHIKRQCSQCDGISRLG